MSVRHLTVVEYKYLFRDHTLDVENEIKNLLVGLGIRTAFPVMARLNFTVRKEKFNSVSDELKFWFGSNSSFVWQYEKKIFKAYPKSEHRSLRILNIWSNFRLLELILQNVDSPEIGQEDSVVSEKLLKAYLLINQLYIASFNHTKILKSIPDEVGKILKTAITVATMLLPYHDINHIDPNDAFLVQSIKAIYFFQFAEEHIPEMLDKYLDTYGVDTWREYLIALLPIADHALQRNKEGLGYLNIDESKPNYEVAKKFLTMLSLGGAQIENSEADFILLRSKPLLQINPNRFLVIDNLLIYNKIYNSLYFEFNKLLADDKELFKKGDFKGFLNSNFSEDYLAKSVLDIVFKNDKFFKISGSEIKAKFGKKFFAEPDYYARNGDEVFIFELKDTYVKGEVKQGFNTGNLMTELKLKLWVKEYEKDGKPKTSPKAVQQLINNIKKVIENTLPFDTDLGNKKLTIFPVLLHIDQSLSTPGISEIVQNWFWLELINEPIIVNTKERVHVMPLTMIDLDTLILMQDEYRDGSFNLAEDILYYWAYKKKLVENGLKEESFQKMTTGMLPFAAFVRMGRKQRKTPDIFMEFARLIFPEEQE